MGIRSLFRLPWRRSTSPTGVRRSSHSGMVRRSLREPVPRSFSERVGRLLRRVPHTPFALILAGTTFGTGYLLWQFAGKSNYFAVTEWSVEGTNRLSEKEVLALVRGKNAESEAPNIWRFGLGDARERVLQHPAVLEVGVERVPPNRVEVRLAERVEVAVLVSSTSAHLVDVQGLLFRRASTAEMLNSELPIITLQGGSSYETGDTLPAEIFDDAMLYILTMQEAESPLIRELSEVSVHPDRGIDLVLRGGARLQCGFLGPGATLPRAEALVARVGWPGAIEYADLRFPEDLPWKPADPEALRHALANR